MESAVLREPELPDNRVAKLAEDLREVRRVVQGFAADMHQNADLLMRAFRQLERRAQRLTQPQTARGDPQLDLFED